MSETDSFIEEVTEEVRRDRLFALMKRYGWIAVLAVVLIVGGAAWREYAKVQAARSAQATGDAMIAALRDDDPLKRAKTFQNLETGDAAARAVALLLAAGEQVDNGDFEPAIDNLTSVANDTELPLIYRQTATFKRLAVQGDTLSVEDRRAGYQELVGPGSELRLLAQEQLALIDVETGDTEAALGRLQGIIADAGATSGLRQRASQLMVALGGTPVVPVTGGTGGEQDDGE